MTCLQSKRQRREAQTHPPEPTSNVRDCYKKPLTTGWQATACKSENEVPVGVTGTYVKSADVLTFPQARRAFQAAALLSYDVPHQAPWRWRVSLYTWTKSVAAGGLGVPVLPAPGT
jgi:hypothetical protein